MTISIIVFSVFCLILFFVGFATKKSDDTEVGYFLGDRSLKSIQIGLSAGATGNTGFIMTGAVGLGYAYGIDWIFLPIAWLIGDLVFWKYFPHKLNDISHNEGIISPITYISKNKIFTIILAVILIVSLGSYASSQFIAASKSLTGFFGLQQSYGIIITCFVIVGYLIFGGFRASVRTDIIQAIMMIFVTTFVLFDTISRYEIFTSYTQLTANLENGFSIPFYNWSIFTIFGFFLGWSSAAVGFGLGQPQIISRYFAGQSSKEVKKAKWTYILFLQFTWLGMTIFGYFLGIGGFKAIDPEAALAEYSIMFFPPVLAGIILAGVFSSIASTIDSMCLSISTTINKDILQKESSKLVRYSTLFIVIATIGAISLTIETHSATVYILAKLAISLMASSLGLAIILKLTLKHISERNIMIGVLLSFVTCIFWYQMGFSTIIVESLPALIIGYLVSFVFYKKMQTPI